MEVIKSFTIDHTRLKPGIYVSREDKGFTTFDLRITEPNQEPAVAPAAMHSLEHLMATWFRNKKAKKDVVYVGPMGCRTGFYFIVRDSITPELAIQLVRDSMAYIAAFEGKIPGAERIQCGNYLAQDLTGAKKAFILLGPANCGKSRILDFVKNFIGRNNFSPLRFSDLGDRFRTSMLLHTNYILNDELGKDIENLDLIKKIVSGEEIVAEEKNKPSFVLKPSIKVAFATNILPLPREVDPGGAFLQRLQILKFSESIDRKYWDLSLDEKLWDERDVIMSLAISKSSEFIRSNFQFTDDPEAVSIVENFALETNSVKAFLADESYVVKDNAEAVHISKLYEIYKLFCGDNCIRAVTARIFSGQLMDLGFTKTRKRLPGDKNPRFVIQGLKTLCEG